MNIYLDNAATSFPKAPGLGSAVAKHIDNCGFNINRSSGTHAAEKTVYETRKLICHLFNCSDPKRVIFTSGATMSCNMLLRGLLKSGDHVVISSMEHHAFMRPLTLLSREGIQFTSVQAKSDGSLDPNAVESAVRPETKLIAATHASNVCGTVLPIYEIAGIAKKHGCFMAADCAQSGGVLDIDSEKMDFTIFSGHKGLMGPQGIGGAVISEALASELRPHIAGGTGSYSHLYTMPDELPDKYEAGTLNIPGIAGLRHSLEYILGIGTSAIRKREEALASRLLDGLNCLPVDIAGKRDTTGRTAVISFVSPYSDNRVLAESLEAAGIALRFGLHCAPTAHKTLGTRETGTIRLSPGYFTTEDEIDLTLEAIRERV